MKASAEASSLAEEAYGIVRRRIVRGTVRLGQVISRRKLAAELRMSFLPVSMARWLRSGFASPAGRHRTIRNAGTRT
jgi:hypothetical protein